MIEPPSNLCVHVSNISTATQTNLNLFGQFKRLKLSQNTLLIQFNLIIYVVCIVLKIQFYVLFLNIFFLVD